MSSQEFTRIIDKTDVKCWIKTDVVDDPFIQNGFRVTWIDWNSNFRDTDLQIEDVIVGYDDTSLEEFLKPGKYGSAIGQHGETGYWQKQGYVDNHTITLKVFRHGYDELLEIPGRLLARRFYTDSENKRALGPNGPPSISTDGFSGAWSSWYEKLVSRMSYVLDGGWDNKRINNKKELEQHNSHKERIDKIAEKYPGPFAEIVLADWTRVQKSLKGKQIKDVDLSYREIGERRAELVKNKASQKWESLHEELKENIIDALPAPDINDRESFKDKCLELPWITTRNIINDLGQTYAVIGNRVEGYYFIHMSGSEKINKMYDVMYRFQSNVNPKLKERYQYMCKITGEPVLVTYDGRAESGLLLKVIAMRAGNGEFVIDLRDDEIKFAGEEKIEQFRSIAINDDTSPQKVMEAMIDAVKLADENTWKSLFATWRAFKYWNNHVAFDPNYIPRAAFPGAWEKSRKLISGRLYDVRVDKISSVRNIIVKNDDVGWPDVEEIDVFLDHFELIDEKYVSFLDVNVRRKWTLQRLNQGPWRIITVQGI